MGGQILIYRHMGWQHRAYVASGLPALQWVADNDSDSVNGIAGQSALEFNVWTRSRSDKKTEKLFRHKNVTP